MAHRRSAHVLRDLGEIPTQPDVSFFLEDLRARTDGEIVAWDLDAVGKLTLLRLKHGRTATDMLAWVSGWRGLFAAAEERWEAALPRFVCYMLSVREDLTAQQLRKVLDLAPQ